jgi:hypothetical protein
VLGVDQVQLDRLLEEREEPETEARLRRSARAAVAVAVILTVLLSLLSWRAAPQATESVDWVARTHEPLPAELESFQPVRVTSVTTRVVPPVADG